MTELITTVNGLAWGPPMLALLLGTGLYLTFGLRFMTWLRVPQAFRLLLRGRSGQGEGDITPFSALMSALTMRW